MMKPLSFLLIILILISGFSQPQATRMKMTAANIYMMKHHLHKGGCCNKNKHDASGSFCNFCVLCIAFIIPVKPGVQRNFAPGRANYPDMVQSKLTDFSSSQWRPPNA
jgi:hypothetical protein